MRQTKTPMNRRVALLGLAFVLAACGISAASTGDADGAATTVTVAADATTTTAAANATDSVTKVSANTASVDEIAAALSAAGVNQADRWAREVVEYRPYDTSDPDLTHLRDELAKYNPAAGVADLIVSVLEP